MEKSLELQFINQQGNVFRIVIDRPIEPVNAQHISSVMDTIIAANIFTSSGGDLVGKKGARLLQRNEEEIALP
ncbi:hypothetical protein GFC29_188 [Anoxybacillus sp. B7M1]|jgi:Protein of unknown function (DUF2922)|uniref:DUF2922 domain-containing protein n=1 Tax=Anoxybacteroides rupiense TaxID=311460 RepID=A0ABD5IPT7_9BACL|nr:MULTISPECIES: DUF2922 domain-containing protein [Anoxybacillus]ANB56363.1 hypothetical protein GFC28_1440 [Anoxybacillus sp. B2M1]ANB63814.1 hypothetical protein GFC29_188 [Anoxybacillus sp. B7M1]KXG10346.1 hypothetical protein AT864_00937 [Anoxybacillus sp. P3H1B]MBB3906370.1 hypothetical protein [Anoxybacillus rupiensis]MBS2770646.1 DUF2922 domain-containing protein [Anoxybacillus rupiensis]